MKKVAALGVATVLAIVLMTPTSSFAWHYGHRGYRGYGGGAIAAGVLGGIATGIILDRVLFPPAVVVERDYPPPPPPARDPYDAGYSEGYERGVQRGRYERYQQGRDRGYDDGYEESRSGRY